MFTARIRTVTHPVPSQGAQCLRLLVLIGSVACAVVAPGRALAATDCVRTVSWVAQPPYAYLASDGSLRGITPELVSAVLKRIDCLPKFVEMPFGRAIVELEDGRMDIMVGVARTTARERFAHFSPPIERHPNALFIAQAVAAKYPLRQLGDIRGTGFRLGHQQNLSYGVEYESLKQDPAFSARLTPVPGRIQAWKMMAAGRLDGLIADEETGLEEIAREGLQRVIGRASVRLETTPSFIALNKKSLSPDFHARFDQALNASIESGELAQIFERHGRCSSVGPKHPCQGKP